MEIFNWELRRKKKKDEPREQLPGVVSPDAQDGALTTTSSGWLSEAHVLTNDLSPLNENELIVRYRDIGNYPECDSAIEDIVTEAIVSDDDTENVEINLDDTEFSEGIKKKIYEEFDQVLRILRFSENGSEIFRTWYVDGRLHYHIVLDADEPQKGIQKVHYIDPRKIRKIKNIKKKRNEQGIDVIEDVEEYFIFNENGIVAQNTTASAPSPASYNSGIKLSKDSVVYVPSGVFDATRNIVLSHLHKAIRPVNQLKMVEIAVVIYRLARAPERRVFYVDVGNLPKQKAEQYVHNIMSKYRNKINYNAETGEVVDGKKYLSMLEDFWMPRREGGKGTEITTLPGGQSLGDIDDIEYFQRKVYQALNVPISRMESDNGFSIGRTTEITRDEVKFSKFIGKLRKKFSKLFIDLMRVQLVAKGIITLEEWDEMSQFIRVNFKKDNYFSELKENEILLQRIEVYERMENLIGKYWSNETVRKNILKQTDEEIKEEDKLIAQEKAAGEIDDQDDNRPAFGDGVKKKDEPEKDDKAPPGRSEQDQEKVEQKKEKEEREKEKEKQVKDAEKKKEEKERRKKSE